MGPDCERAQMSVVVKPSPCSRRDEPLALGGRWSE